MFRLPSRLASSPFRRSDKDGGNKNDGCVEGSERERDQAVEGEHSENGKEVSPYDRIEVFDGHQLKLITRTDYFSSAISWATF